jgi:hypothetical protein
MTKQLPREIRNVIRTAVTSATGWKEWRAANLRRPDGVLPDASQLYTSEIIRAAVALGVDVVGIAAGYSVTVTAADLAAYSTEKETADMTSTAAAAPAVENIAPAPVVFEGRDPADVLREVLAPADGMVGAKLFDLLASSVAPLAQAAVAGPRIVTQTRTVTVRAAGDGDAEAPRLVNTTGKAKARDLFGLKASDCKTWRDVLEGDVSTWDGTPADGVPDRDAFHVWDAEALAYLVLAARYADENHPLRNASRLLMFGPAGTGKTTTAAQFAAATGRPFVRIAFDRTTEAAELVGQRMPKFGGGTEFREGALVRAMQVPGAVILLDEPSFLRPGVAAVLQTILDTGVAFLKEDGNRKVELAPGVVICAADNTNLTGDTTGRYADTMAQNVALQDRFAYLVAMDYLPEAREAEVLVHRTGIARAAADVMVAFATTTRKGAAGGTLTTGLSLRRLVAWATGCVAGVPSNAAFVASIINCADPTDRETLRGLERNVIDHTRMTALVKGLPLPDATPAPAPTSAKAAAAADVFGAAPFRVTV